MVTQVKMCKKLPWRRVHGSDMDEERLTDDMGVHPSHIFERKACEQSSPLPARASEQAGAASLQGQPMAVILGNDSVHQKSV